MRTRTRAASSRRGRDPVSSSPTPRPRRSRPRHGPGEALTHQVRAEPRGRASARGARAPDRLHAGGEQDGRSATNGRVVVTDYLPASLEFLGCGGVDNSAAPEYAGAPSLTATPTPPGCVRPVSVTTVANPPARARPCPPGVYTRVQWDLGTMAPNDGDPALCRRRTAARQRHLPVGGARRREPAAGGEPRQQHRPGDPRGSQRSPVRRTSRAVRDLPGAGRPRWTARPRRRRPRHGDHRGRADAQVRDAGHVLRRRVRAVHGHDRDQRVRVRERASSSPT